LGFAPQLELLLLDAEATVLGIVEKKVAAVTG
jgi:hypothetical protein